MMWQVALLLPLVALTRGLFWSEDEVCCPRIGCFDSEGVMSHLPLPSCPDDLGVKFFLLTRNHPTISTSPQITYDSTPSEYDPKKMTILTSHGWMGQADMDWMRDMASGLLSRFDANLIVADWKDGASKVYYPQAAANVRTVGTEIGHLLTHLVDHHGDSYDNMWCVGFSLGAHVCGWAGMATKGKIRRVTGLDPAGPSFENRDVMNGINPSAAQFVDVIHTDGGGIVSYYGLIDARGHADFYPNGGRDQPGCYFGRRKREVEQQVPDTGNGQQIDGMAELPSSTLFGSNVPVVGCDHYRGVHYFLDTLVEDNCHVSTLKCSSFDKMPQSCWTTPKTQMGLFADRNEDKRGLFYLETGKRSPYCKK